MTNGTSQIMIVKSGKCIRFEEEKLDQWVEQASELGITLKDPNDEVRMICNDMNLCT